MGGNEHEPQIRHMNLGALCDFARVSGSRNGLPLGDEGRGVFFFRLGRQVGKMLAPGNVRGQKVRKAVDMGKPVVRRIAENIGRLFPLLKALDRRQQVLAHGDHRLVAHPEVLFAAVEDRSHALGGAGVVVEKILDARVVHRLLHLPILEIVIAGIADARVIRADLFPPVDLFFPDGAASAKTEVIAPRERVVIRNVHMNLEAVELPRAAGTQPRTGITKLEKRTYC